MMVEEAGRVYAVRLADDFEYRYVGQTTTTLVRRMQRHASVARSGRVTPFYSWLRAHAADDIEIDEIEVVHGERELLGQRERFWISLMRSNGQRLLNVSEGGLGPSGVTWSLEQREAARLRSLGRPGTPRPGAANPFFGRRHSAQQRAAWSRSRAGSNRGPLNPNYGKFGADHPSFGHTVSDATRQAQSEAKLGARNPNFGKRASPETRARQSAAQRGVPKPSSVRSAHTRYHTNKHVWKSTCKHCSEITPPPGFQIL